MQQNKPMVKYVCVCSTLQNENRYIFMCKDEETRSRERERCEKIAEYKVHKTLFAKLQLVCVSRISAHGQRKNNEETKCEQKTIQWISQPFSQHICAANKPSNYTLLLLHSTIELSLSSNTLRARKLNRKSWFMCMQTVKWAPAAVS